MSLPLKVGTDFSGIEAPLFALKALGINFEHSFACEIDPFARKSLLANNNPLILYEDVTKPRDLPLVDIYVAGFPCQSFSTAGKRLGSKDPRGTLFFHCIEAIKQCKPKVFVLENVKGLLTVEHGAFWKLIKESLNTLVDYSIKTMVLNTSDYGIPQTRERLYIVGIMKSSMLGLLQVPSPIPCLEIESFVDREDTHIEHYPPSMLKKEEFYKGLTFCNVDMMRARPRSKNCPTLLVQTVLWNIAMHRRANTKELLALQGFLEDFKIVTCKTQLRKQIGNSMSVCVLQALFKEIFKVVKF